VLPIIVERPMYFNYYSPNVGWADGGHNAVGVTPYHDPGQFVWWFAEGWTGSGFAELITVQNPNDLAAYLTFTYFRDNGQPPIVINESVNGLSRRTFDVRGHVSANQAVSLKLQSDRWVNVERPMYFNYYGATTGWADGGHNAVGAVTAEYSWYFAEGTTRPGFDQYLTIQNPGNAGPNNPSNLVAAVEVTYRTASGGQFGPYTFYVQPKRRITLAPRDQIGWDQDFATEIKSSLPIVAERPMYFTYGAGGWKGGHVVMGLPKPEYRFYFAEGWTGSGFDEFVALFNTHSSAYAFVTMQYMFPDGGVTTRYVYIAPKTRQTINVNAEVEANQAVSIKVTSDMPIIAERMMYFNYYSPVVGWADGGHVAVGYSP
jgi:hypothetical protein